MVEVDDCTNADVTIDRSFSKERRDSRMSVFLIAAVMVRISKELDWIPLPEEAFSMSRNLQMWTRYIARFFQSFSIEPVGGLVL
jgi:hypothetical protein